MQRFLFSIGSSALLSGGLSILLLLILLLLADTNETSIGASTAHADEHFSILLGLS